MTKKAVDSLVAATPESLFLTGSFLKCAQDWAANADLADPSAMELHGQGSAEKFNTAVKTLKEVVHDVPKTKVNRCGKGWMAFGMLLHMVQDVNSIGVSGISPMGS